VLRAVLTAALLAALLWGPVPAIADAGGPVTGPPPAESLPGNSPTAGHHDEKLAASRGDFADNTTDAGPRLVELYPNPVTTGDSGEFVTVQFPPGANYSAYELADNDATVALSNATTIPTANNATRRLTFSTHPNQTASLTDRAVATLSDRIRLANSGDSVRLLRNGTVVDRVQYTSAAEAEAYNVTTQRWRSLEATDRPVVTAEGGRVEAFVLPDESGRAVEFLDNASDRVLLAGYTFASERAVEALSRAIERGVTVEVLVDGSPVGGMTGQQAATLDSLARAGAKIQVAAGERTWYRYHHAKYAVVDDRALVTTENWKPAGTGGASSRGWAAITGQQPIITGLVETFRADAKGNDTRPWREHDPTLTASESSTGTYPQTFESATLPVERTHLLVAPDNAEAAILDRIERAEESIDVLQVTLGSHRFPFLQAVLDAAARGVEVRILLSGAWYVEKENRQLVTWLEEQAAAANLSLSARVVEPGDAFEKIHAKGVVIDDEEVILGSINWNNNSVRNNREVAVVLEGEAVAAYFREVFEADWSGGDSGRRLPLGLALACLFGAVLAVLGARKIRFDGRGK